jgi:hypothetical protein
VTHELNLTGRYCRNRSPKIGLRGVSLFPERPKFILIDLTVAMFVELSILALTQTGSCWFSFVHTNNVLLKAKKLAPTGKSVA